MVKFIEVKEANKFTGLQGTDTQYTLREIFINPEHVVCIREDESAKRQLSEGCMPSELDKRQDFTMIHLNRGQAGIDVTVIGAPVAVEQKLKNSKQLLKG